MELNKPITERRRQTRSSIYQYLYRHNGFCSKKMLASDMELSLPTVYQNLTELIDAGLVGYSGEQRSTGGRRANGLDILPEAKIAVGISVTDSRIRMSVTDLRLHELCYRSLLYHPDRDFTRFCTKLAQDLEIFLDDNGVDRSKLLGVGIAVPGILSADGSSLLYAPTLKLHNLPVSVLRGVIPYPVYLQNDATCGGYAEWFVRNRNTQTDSSTNMAYVSLESGVGGAIMIGGKLYNGSQLRGGEFGHMCVETGGMPCRCGRKGCLEAYCSSMRISDELGISLDEFFCGLSAGNAEYAALWEDVLHRLAIGINNINMVLDCGVVLGGFLAQYLEPYLPKLRQYVAEGNTFAENGDFVEISRLKNHSVPLGAALYYIKDFIESV